MNEIGIVMGSRSDYAVMRKAEEVLADFGVPFHTRIVSAHRTPDLLFQYAEMARSRGLAVIIAGAGGAAHLPGMLAAKTSVPVLGVPIHSLLQGVDSLLSIAQMPFGIPVATFAIDGAANAALFAVQLLSISDLDTRQKIDNFRDEQTRRIRDSQL